MESSITSKFPRDIGFDTINLTSKDPMELFVQWRQEAMSVPENNMVDAMTLATVKPDGTSSARTVLLRGMDNLGYKICTDYRSQKGQEIAQNSSGALVLLWKFVRGDGMQGSRQIRVEGRIEKLSNEESQAYFDSEPILSQIRTSVLNQTSNIYSMRAESQRLLNLANQEPNYQISKPPQWGGYRLRPEMMEFYQDVQDEFSDLVRFRKQTADERNDNFGPGILEGGNGWTFSRQYVELPNN